MSVYTVDGDCDGVLNTQDQLPNEPDFGDYDGDLIPNATDLRRRVSCIQNGSYVDSDRDGLWEDLDSYWGNNFADDDRDGILNGHDRQPKVAAPPNSRNAQDDRIQDIKTGEMIVLAQMRNQAFRDYLSKDPTIAPRLPNPLLTDSDRDGFNDYYDPFPRNAYIHQKNDVYTVGSDAWHEKQQEKKRQNTPTTRFGGKALIDLDGKKSVVELADN